MYGTLEWWTDADVTGRRCANEKSETSRGETATTSSRLVGFAGAHIFTELINQRWSSGAPASAAKDYVEVSQGHQYGGRRLLLITAAGPVHWPQPATVGERRAVLVVSRRQQRKSRGIVRKSWVVGNLQTLIVSVRSCWHERVENPKKQIGRNRTVYLIILNLYGKLEHSYPSKFGNFSRFFLTLFVFSWITYSKHTSHYPNICLGTLRKTG